MKYIINKQIQSIIVGCQSVCPVKKLRPIAIFLTDKVSKLFKEIEDDEKISEIIFNILKNSPSESSGEAQSDLHNLYVADSIFSKENFSEQFDDIDESKREDYIKDFSSIIRTVTFCHLTGLRSLIYFEQKKALDILEKKRINEHKLIMKSINVTGKNFLYYNDPNEEKEEEIDEGSEVERILAME